MRIFVNGRGAEFFRALGWGGAAAFLSVSACGPAKTQARTLGCEKISPTHYYNTVERLHDASRASHVAAVRVIIGRGFEPDETAGKFSLEDLRCWRGRNDAIAPYLLVGKTVGAYREMSITTRLTPNLVEGIVSDLVVAARGHRCPESLEIAPPRSCDEGLPEAQYILGVIQRDYTTQSLRKYSKTYWMEKAAKADFRPAPVLLKEMK